MGDGNARILLDVTRLVSLYWTGRQATGIDRVCLAYLDQFRERCLPVVQHRGLLRTLGENTADRLFDLFGQRKGAFRRGFSALLPSILAEPRPGMVAPGTVYLNTSHTDFDLQKHFAWVQEHGLRSVYFIHDLIPILNPELSRPRAVRRHLGRLRLALRHADLLLVSSRTVERDVRRLAGNERLDCPEIVVSHLAGAPLVSAESAPVSPNTPYFLCVGTIEPRKNHDFLLGVWSRLVARFGAAAPRLLIIGQCGPLTGRCLQRLSSDHALSQHVDLIDTCNDAELARLMRGATALLSPTLAEGFGLPLVEALQMNVPVIASDIPIFREIGQDIPQLLDPANEDEWERGIVDRMQGASPTNAVFEARSWEDHFQPFEAWLAGQSQSPHAREFGTRAA